jgi:outer membrane protein assembly factor BamA
VTISLHGVSARAEESTRVERNVADSMAQSHEEAAGPGLGARWSLLPQIGYDPESQINAGVKVRNEDLLDSGFFLDVNAVLSLNHRQEASFSLGDPHWWDDLMLAYLTVSGVMDDQKEFFGIGDNDVGPDPVSNHNIRRIVGTATLGRKFLDDTLTLNLSLTYRWTKIGIGQSHKTPSTTTLFPDLPGIRGGRSNEIAVSAVYSDRENVERPTRGWLAILRVAGVPDLFGNDFSYTRLLFDVSYLLPLLTRRQVLGVRVDGEALLGPSSQIPFYELSSLGGEDTLRGYFPQRFLGKGRALGSAEYRLKLIDFYFWSLWEVMIDGVAFADVGRVWTDAQDFENHVLDDYRWDYGGGLRIAFSSGEVARIDVAVSEENKGLVYLAFGHTF